MATARKLMKAMFHGSSLGTPSRQGFMNKALEAYIEAALWSSTDDDGEPMDDSYDYGDISFATRQEMRKDVEAFIRVNVADIGDMDAGQVGHDFWLTRNHHGAGFWDRGLGARGKRLTDAAHVYGESDIYVGDDGKLYVS